MTDDFDLAHDITPELNDAIRNAHRLMRHPRTGPRVMGPSRRRDRVANHAPKRPYVGTYSWLMHGSTVDTDTGSDDIPEPFRAAFM